MPDGRNKNNLPDDMRKKIENLKRSVSKNSSKNLQNLNSKAAVVSGGIKNLMEKLGTAACEGGENESGCGASFGDVIGVSRGSYDHYGIYVNDRRVISYKGASGDFSGLGSGNKVCVDTLGDFLAGASSFFVCVFPDLYGRPEKVSIDAPVFSFSNIIQPDIAFEIFELIGRLFKTHKYKLYSPEETVRRAESGLGEKKYNIVSNNCEHFVLWCKTGISESHQVEDLKKILNRGRVILSGPVVY